MNDDRYQFFYRLGVVCGLIGCWLGLFVVFVAWLLAWRLAYLVVEGLWSWLF